MDFVRYLKAADGLDPVANALSEPPEKLPFADAVQEVAESLGDEK